MYKSLTLSKNKHVDFSFNKRDIGNNISYMLTGDHSPHLHVCLMLFGYNLQLNLYDNRHTDENDNYIEY